MPIQMFDEYNLPGFEAEAGRAPARRRGAARPQRRSAAPAAPARRAHPVQAQRPPARPVGRRVGYGMAAEVAVTSNDEFRTGLVLSSADTAGNANITAFTGQTTAQHPFLCVGVAIEWDFANDPALATDAPAYISFTAAPTVKGLAIVDGNIKIPINKSHVIMLAKPMKIMEQTSLQHGTATLVGGTANMRYSTTFRCLTQLDLANYRSNH